MLEFKQEQLLLNMSTEQRIDRELIRKLAKCIADFHLKSDAIDPSSFYGSLDSIKDVVFENFAETKSGIGSYFPKEDYFKIQAYQIGYLDNYAKQFSQRKQDGKVRSCHGDLHLGNICYFDDKVMLFDCIEFSEDFRNIDVLYDLAFTIMDLHFRDLPEQANLLLNQYLEWSADYEGLNLLPFYCSIRAYIRAKVLFFATNSQDPKLHPDLAKQISKYVSLARSYAEATRGLLIVVCGVSGSGKSTLARELAVHLDAVHLRSDVIRKHLGQVALLDKGDESLYSPEMTKKTYQELLKLALQSQKFTHVIVDAKFDLKDLRQPYLDQKESGVTVRFIHCTAPKQELKTRLDNRHGDASDADASLIDSQLDKWQDFSGSGDETCLSIDTCQDLDAQVSRCLSFIRQENS